MVFNLIQTIINQMQVAPKTIKKTCKVHLPQLPEHVIHRQLLLPIVLYHQPLKENYRK